MPRQIHTSSRQRLPLLPMLLMFVSSAAYEQALAETASDRTVAAVEVNAPAPATSVIDPPLPTEIGIAGISTLSEAQAAPALATSVQPAHRIAIGSATERLLTMQSTLPSLRPRYIDGEQANRSYQRYLKSFETSIPEYYETGVSTK